MPTPPVSSAQPLTNRLTPEQIASYHEHGFLHIPRIFDPDHLALMKESLDWMIRDWANIGVGWTGPWRKALMDAQTETNSKLIAMHDLQYYDQSWMRAVTKNNLANIVSQLLAEPNEEGSYDPSRDAPVEFHHSTMHVKPAETGHPFPMHQDLAFYDHADDRYIDVLVHLDDTCHENGEIRFVDGSHKLGRLDHVTSFMNDDGKREDCTPHLPWDQFSLADTVPVPAKAGDIVVFNILTIHGSHINTTDKMRRLVRVGYKHPENIQTGGQSSGRPNLMVKGRRKRIEGQVLYSTECHGVADIRSEEDAFAINFE